MHNCAQVQASLEGKARERAAYLEEGRKLREAEAREKARLEEVGLWVSILFVRVIMCVVYRWKLRAGG